MFPGSSLSIVFRKIDDLSTVYLYQLFELIHQDCLGLMGHLLTFFFSQINEFLQEVTLFQEEKSEALLKRIHPLGHLSDSRHLSLIHNRSLNTVDFKRPHVICCSFFDHLPAHQLQRSISHSLKSLFSYLSSQQVLNRWFNSLRQPTFR